MAGGAFVVVTVLWAWPKLKRALRLPAGTSGPAIGPASAIGKWGFGLTFVFYLITCFVFVRHRDWFLSNAHSIAAITMFVFIFLAVADNALNLALSQEPGALHRVNRYGQIAVAMLIAAAVIVGLKVFGHFEYWTIWLEASMIALFAVFWVVQTHELWSRGLRSGVSPDPAEPVV